MRTRAQSFVALVSLVAWCACALALDPTLDISQYSHTSWKVRDGFTKGRIQSIAQTPDGYLWFGTEFGLVRFDGVRTVPWQPSHNQHLPSGTIYSLLVSHNGTLWIGTTTGLASWKEDKLTLYHEFDGTGIYTLFEDREGTVWVGAGGTTRSGKLCWIRSGTVDCFGSNGELGPGVFVFHEDKKGSIWAGVLDGLWRLKPGRPKFYLMPGELDGIRALAEDDDGSLLVGWRGGIYRFNNGKTQRYLVNGILH